MVAMSTLGISAAIDFGIQAVAGAAAIVLGTEKFYDLAGAGTFLTVTAYNLSQIGLDHTRQAVLSGAVMLWSSRLGLFLFTRVLQAGGDRRFARAKQKPGLFAFYWFLQGVWVFMSLLPVLCSYTSLDEDVPLQALDYVGWSMFGVGFLFETIADSQKASFRANSANKDKFISSGLWSLSRHPNYFGEILLWCGIYVGSLPVLSGWKHISALSPIFITWLLTRVSGVPLLERHAEKRWGDNPEYKAYVQRTPVLFPRLF